MKTILDILRKHDLLKEFSAFGCSSIVTCSECKFRTWTGKCRILAEQASRLQAVGADDGRSKMPYCWNVKYIINDEIRKEKIVAWKKSSLNN